MIALNNAGAGSIRFASFRGAGGQFVYDGNTGAGFIADNDWHHVAIVSDGSTVTLYLDGDAGTDLGGTYGILASGPATNTISLGGYAGFAGSSFNGDLDEVRIWNATVSAGDVAGFANTTDISSHPNYDAMLAYYKFDDGTGSTILEDVFANNDGALTNMDENTDWVTSGALSGALAPVPTDLFTTEVSDTQIDLSWTDTAPNETAFAILRSDGNNSSYTEINTVAADVTTYSDNTVTPDNNYFYQVVARNGNGDSAPSNEKERLLL